jgi:Flp pilus assembly protein TadG
MMRKFFTHCWNSEQGIAAVEFAFVLPVILTMLLGLVELSQALGVRADVINMASTGGDLIAQEATAKGTDLDSVFNALNSMLYPHDATQATVTITSVIDGGIGIAPKVAWSCTEGKHPALETKGSAPSVAIPAGLTVPAGPLEAGKGGSVIWSRVSYDYNSTLSYFLVGTHVWNNDFYLNPRRVLQIPLSGSPSVAGSSCTS